MKRFMKIRQRSLIDRSLLNLILWILIWGLFSGLFFTIDYFDGTIGGGSGRLHDGLYSPYTWAPIVTIVIGIIGFYIAGADIIYYDAKRRARNVVAWTTASIVFSPCLAAIAYLLTWPKNNN